MKKIFQLDFYQTTVSREFLSGVTSFLTMSYILFVNPVILSDCGMPAEGVFVATALVAAGGTILLGLAANVPLAMAPGMGLNTFCAYTVCLTLGFHWRECLALVLITGLLHVLLMCTRMRKDLVNAIPEHLKLAFGVGLGLFIAYTGLKNAGFLMFIVGEGHYALSDGGTIISGSGTVPAFTEVLDAGHFVAIIGFSIMVVLLALERKTGDSYAALPAGIVTAAAIGIPLGITNPTDMAFIDIEAVRDLKEVFGAFWGRPGLLSLFSRADRLPLIFMIILILLLTNVMDTIGTVMGIGRMEGVEIFDRQDLDKFQQEAHSSRLDRTLMANAVGGPLAAIVGSTTATTFMESVTGVAAGGRTGLTAVTTGLIFIACLPLVGIFKVIPPAAIAPALIVAGAFMIPLAARIDWSSFEECLPAFMTILCIPLTYSFVHGIAAGVLTHVLMQIALGQGRAVHPMLYAIAAIFCLVLTGEALRS